LFWVNSVTVKKRKQTSEGAARWGVWLRDGVHIRFNLKDYLDSFTLPNNLEVLLSEMQDRFLGAPIPERAKSRIKSSVLGDKDDHYWTDLVDAYLNNPTSDNRNQLNWRLEQLLYQFFELAEIHLM
jgi:hypothetical protein